MKENEDKLLESLVEKAMKSSGLETPSSDFTNNIMAHVTAKSSATVYQPLISKTVWMLIFGSVLAFVVYFYKTAGVESNNWFEAINFSVVSNNGLAKFFSGLEMANVTFYAMLVCGLMLCAQIPILKYFLNKRQQGLF